MVKPRLLKELGDSKKYIFFIVATQTIILISQIGVVFSLVSAISLATATAIDWRSIALMIAIVIACLVIRTICEKQISKFSYLASCDVKRKLRSRIFEKMLKLGGSYSEILGNLYRSRRLISRESPRHDNSEGLCL